MAKRTKKKQTSHDRMVKKIARKYEKRGCYVEADISGYKRPKSINRRRPDLYVECK